VVSIIVLDLSFSCGVHRGSRHHGFKGAIWLCRLSLWILRPGKAHVTSSAFPVRPRRTRNDNSWIKYWNWAWVHVAWVLTIHELNIEIELEFTLLGCWQFMN
jgi:hypothetical protein